MADFNFGDFGFGFGEETSDGQMDFSSFFAPTPEAPAPAKEKKGEKKAEKKAASASTKKDEKKASRKGKKEEDFEVSLPITVVGRNFKTTVEADGVFTRKISEVLKDLSETYEEICLSTMTVAYSEASNTIYLCNKGVSPLTEDSIVFFGNGAITIVDGETKCEVDSSMFEGYESDEITADLLAEKWCDINPVYSGCGVYVEAQRAYPCFKTTLAGKDKITLPCDVLVNGEWRTIEDDGTEYTADTLIRHLFGDENDAVTVSLATNADKSAYFVVYSQKTARDISKGGVATVASVPKKAEKKYRLPLTVMIGNFNVQFEVTQDDLGGKEKATLDEIKEFASNRYSIFKDTSRQLDVMYLEEDNLLSLMFISGKKGYEVEEKESYGSFQLLRSTKELEEVLSRPFFMGHSLTTASVRTR